MSYGIDLNFEPGRKSIIKVLRKFDPAIWKQIVANLLSLSFTVFPSFFRGEPIGLMDAEGREIIPAKYSQIRCLGAGFYIVRSVAPGLQLGNELFLFNRKGKPIAANVPSSTKFAGVFDLGTVKGSSKEELPPDAVLIFSHNKKLGLCDTKGKILLPARYAAIDMVNGGTPLVFDAAIAGLENPYIESDPHPTLNSRAYTWDKSQGLTAIAITGIVFLEPDYKDGLRCYSTNLREEKFGFLDKNYKIAIKPTFKGFDQREEPKLPGPRIRIDKSRFGLVDSNGKWLIEPSHSILQQTRGGKFILSDEKGTFVVSQIKDGTLSMSAVKKDSYPFFHCIPKIEFRSNSKYTSAEAKAFTETAFQNVISSRKVHDDGISLTHWHTIDESNCDEPRIAFASTPAQNLASNVAWAKCEPDRYVMKHPAGSYWFDEIAWKNRNEIHGMQMSRPNEIHVWVTGLDLFNRFLHEHDVIGMSREALVQLLDAKSWSDNRKDDTILSVTLVSGGCLAGTYMYADFNIIDNKVASWHFHGPGGKSREFTENVVIVPELRTNSDGK